ncbi:MAG TPA: glycosyltransferase family 4 protein [Candidatus Wujingus californicus]|uniref:glycosyltransferase family 4 protein n=1 Tax=Candidatus Wujingus californicus TaxID=3367618 RepID=UPI001DAEB0DD|nr:glycosyltransferase family 4 protein [Planctomycetota bacterium]MDO8130485.1 glycosyltransferase family 4 protein [Candidatus Brocadiales bacterium]
MGHLKITYVLPVYWPAIGGCELHTHELVKRLSEKYDVKVITLIDNQHDKLSGELWFACILKAPANATRYKDNFANVTRLPLTPVEKFVNFPFARIQSPKLPSFIIKLAMENLSNFYMKKLIGLIETADVLHCVHGGVSYLGYAALKASKRLGIPFVYTPVLHLYHKDQTVGMNNTNYYSYNPQLCLSPRGWTDNYWYKLCCEADAIIAMTDFERNYFIKEGIDSKKLYNVGVGPLFADKTTEDIRQKYNLNNKRIILFLGRNVAYKGIEELLKAANIVWEKFPDTYFFFAGPKEGNSEEIFRRYCDPRIIVMGVVSENGKTALLEACDVFCMPSLEESLGGTFLEAWMFEKPIIGAKIPPLVEITSNGQGGFLVNPTPEDIADKIMTLLQNPEMAKFMGQWGKRRVLENYTWEIIIKKVEDIYYDIIKRRKNI